MHAFQVCNCLNKNVRLFLQFSGNVSIDVNGKVKVYKISYSFKLLYVKNTKSENFIKNLIIALFIYLSNDTKISKICWPVETEYFFLVIVKIH